jgi:hypothetical protein
MLLTLVRNFNNRYAVPERQSFLDQTEKPKWAGFVGSPNALHNTSLHFCGYPTQHVDEKAAFSNRKLSRSIR